MSTSYHPAIAGYTTDGCILRNADPQAPPKPSDGHLVTTVANAGDQLIQA